MYYTVEKVINSGECFVHIRCHAKETVPDLRDNQISVFSGNNT